jgi:hypothetical protein
MTRVRLSGPGLECIGVACGKRIQLMVVSGSSGSPGGPVCPLSRDSWIVVQRRSTWSMSWHTQAPLSFCNRKWHVLRRMASFLLSTTPRDHGWCCQCHAKSIHARASVDATPALLLRHSSILYSIPLGRRREAKYLVAGPDASTSTSTSRAADLGRVTTPRPLAP